MFSHSGDSLLFFSPFHSFVYLFDVSGHICLGFERLWANRAMDLLQRMLLLVEKERPPMGELLLIPTETTLHWNYLCLSLWFVFFRSSKASSIKFFFTSGTNEFKRVAAVWRLRLSKTTHIPINQLAMAPTVYVQLQPVQPDTTGMHPVVLQAWILNYY